jgi:hypothetical protein
MLLASGNTLTSMLTVKIFWKQCIFGINNTVTSAANSEIFLGESLPPSPPVATSRVGGDQNSITRLGEEGGINVGTE